MGVRGSRLGVKSGVFCFVLVGYINYHRRPPGGEVKGGSPRTGPSKIRGGTGGRDGGRGRPKHINCSRVTIITRGIV